MTTIPPYLQKGDTIGIVAPAGYMAFEKIQACIQTLQQWGYQVKLGATVHSTSQNYFSGTDEERLNDLQDLLDDKNIKAIFCVRGGYGASRIIDQLHFKKFKKRPKWIIGFSDITVLHLHVYANYKIASLHAPMAAAFNNDEPDNPYLLSIKKVLEGKDSHYAAAAHPLNRTGKSNGILVGGNLTLLAHLTGTVSDIKAKNKLLFIEDVAEYFYNIDRLLLQLKRSGKLDNLAGLIVGGFTDCKDTERPFGKDVYEIIREAVKEYKYPVCFNFPVSHTAENYALKIGAQYTFHVTDTGAVLAGA